MGLEKRRKNGKKRVVSQDMGQNGKGWGGMLGQKKRKKKKWGGYGWGRNKKKKDKEAESYEML